MKKIMIIDDVEISNFIMKKMIEKVSPGAEIHDYLFAEKAINELEQISPEIIFLDLNMPVMNGWEFLDNMVQNNQTNMVYILTSSTSELDLLRSKNYGNVKDFLIKPIGLSALTTILNND